MRVYSDLLKKPFDTEEEALEAENKFKAEQEKKKKEEEQKELTKKQLVNKIEEAERNLEKEYENLTNAKEEVKKILEESNKKMDTILNDAKLRVKRAEDARFDAIRNYNKLYGTYTVYYDSNKTDTQNKEFVKRLDNLFNPWDWLI